MGTVRNSYEQSTVEECLDWCAGHFQEHKFAECATATDSKGAYHTEDVVCALFKADGNLGKMAKLLNRRRSALWKHIRDRQDMWRLWTDFHESKMDTVENLHWQAALDGDLGAQRFLLQTKGKDRGYSTRQETTGADGQPLVHETKLTFSPEDAERMLEWFEERF